MNNGCIETFKASMTRAIIRCGKTTTRRCKRCKQPVCKDHADKHQSQGCFERDLRKVPKSERKVVVPRRKLESWKVTYDVPKTKVIRAYDQQDALARLEKQGIEVGGAIVERVW